MLDYVTVIGMKFPNCQVSCFGDPMNYENLQWETGTPLPSRETLDASRLEIRADQVWERIKAMRESKALSGVQVGGYWFHSDDTSRIKYLGLTLLSSAFPVGLQWKTMSGEFVTMTMDLVRQVFRQIALSDTIIFAIAEDHRQAMLASSDPLAYDFSTNWPDVYQDVK